MIGCGPLERKNGWQKRSQAILGDIPAFGGVEDKVIHTRRLKTEIKEKQERITPKAKCRKSFKKGEIHCQSYERSGQIRAGIIHSWEQEERHRR